MPTPHDAAKLCAVQRVVMRTRRGCRICPYIPVNVHSNKYVGIYLVILRVDYVIMRFIVTLTYTNTIYRVLAEVQYGV